MHLIVKDYLNRKAWVYLGSWLGHLLVTMFMWQQQKVMVLALVAGGGAFLLMFELMQRGGSAPRTLLSLPVSAGQLAKSWRFVALEFPALIFFVALVIGAVLAKLSGIDQNLSWERFCIMALVQTLLLGVMFLALTGFHTGIQPAMTWQDRIRNYAASTLWGLSIPGAFILTNFLPSDFSGVNRGHLVAGGLMLIATVAGWFRAEVLVRNRTRRQGTGGIPRTLPRRGDQPNRDKKSWTGFGGLPWFVFKFGRHIGLIALAILFFNWLGIEWFNRTVGSSRNYPRNFGQAAFVIPVLALVFSFSILNLLRSLRAMPISLIQLTNLLVFASLILGMAFQILTAGIYFLLFGEFPELLTVVAGLTSCSVVLLALPVFLKFGFRLWAFVAICVIVPMSMIFGTPSDYRIWRVLSEDGKLLLCGIVFVFAASTSWILSHQLLKKSRPWRAGIFNAPIQRR